VRPGNEADDSGLFLFAFLLLFFLDAILGIDRNLLQNIHYLALVQ
jgi:hypothetical protein